MTQNPFNREAFFDQMIDSLRYRGIFKTYGRPLGTTRDCPLLKKHPHRNPEKNALFTCHHIGDEPYIIPDDLPFDRYEELNMTKEEKTLRATSAREAFKAYFPIAEVRAYQDYFLKHVSKISHQLALGNAFKAIERQLGYKKKTSPEALESMLQDTGCKRNTIRTRLAESQETKQIANHPELLLALGLFHALHSSYLAQFRLALERNTTLTDDERDNAAFTLHSNAFRQMGQFATFHEMLVPLILHEYHKLGGQEKTDDALMRQAIASAWKQFETKEVLIRDYDARGLPPEPGEAAAFSSACPVNVFFQNHHKALSLEAVYDHVVAHRDELQKELHQAQAVGKRVRDTEGIDLSSKTSVMGTGGG